VLDAELSLTVVGGGASDGSRLPAKALQASDVRDKVTIVNQSTLLQNINFLQARSLPLHTINWIINCEFGIRSHDLSAYRFESKGKVPASFFFSWPNCRQTDVYHRTVR